MTTKIYGNSVTLRGHESEVLRPGDNGTKSAAQDVVDKVADRFNDRAVTTIERVADENGKRLANPRVVIAIDPKGLYIDLVGDQVDANEGLAWFAEQFNIVAFKSNVRAAVKRGCDWWTNAHFGEFIVADQTGVTNTRNRPV